MSILFQETQLNALNLKNRFVRAATWTGMAGEGGSATPELLDLIDRLAEGGVGLIITGHAFVHADGIHSHGQLGMDRDELLPGLQQMTRLVHDRGGRIAAQLGFGGHYLAQSRVADMPVGYMDTIVEAFAQAADRARRAGFDGVEIMAAHGFLLSQFLCPRYNPREDEYGGSLKNRARLALRVLKAVKGAVGKDFPVLVKINASDRVENGMTLSESVRVASMLQDNGADGLELSGGLLNVANLIDGGDGSEKDKVLFEDAARTYKKSIHIPLILVGGIRSYQKAKSLVLSGAADYVAMCRPLIREPDLIARWKSGNTADASCISCNNCVQEAVNGSGIACLPEIKREKEPSFFLQKTVRLAAGAPLPPGSSYVLSSGIERWGEAFLPVIKIQLEPKGKDPGEGLTIPQGGQDHATIFKAVEALISENNEPDKDAEP